MATCAALHRTGVAVLEELLGVWGAYPRQVPCGCGQPAQFHEMRPKHLLTVLGRVETERPYYLCPHCHQGQSPRDRELDVVGGETSFEQRREQLEL